MNYQNKLLANLKAQADTLQKDQAKLQDTLDGLVAEGLASMDFEGVTDEEMATAIAAATVGLTPKVKKDASGAPLFEYLELSVGGTPTYWITVIDGKLKTQAVS